MEQESLLSDIRNKRKVKIEEFEQPVFHKIAYILSKSGNSKDIDEIIREEKAVKEIRGRLEDCSYTAETKAAFESPLFFLSTQEIYSSIKNILKYNNPYLCFISTEDEIMAAVHLYKLNQNVDENLLKKYKLSTLLASELAKAMAIELEEKRKQLSAKKEESDRKQKEEEERKEKEREEKERIEKEKIEANKKESNETQSTLEDIFRKADTDPDENADEDGPDAQLSMMCRQNGFNNYLIKKIEWELGIKLRSNEENPVKRIKELAFKIIDKTDRGYAKLIGKLGISKRDLKLSRFFKTVSRLINKKLDEFIFKVNDEYKTNLDNKNRNKNRNDQNEYADPDSEDGDDPKNSAQLDAEEINESLIGKYATVYPKGSNDGVYYDCGSTSRDVKAGTIGLITKVDPNRYYILIEFSNSHRLWVTPREFKLAKNRSNQLLDNRTIQLARQRAEEPAYMPDDDTSDIFQDLVSDIFDQDDEYSYSKKRRDSFFTAHIENSKMSFEREMSRLDEKINYLKGFMEGIK